MTVSELIEILQQKNPDAIVVICNTDCYHNVAGVWEDEATSCELGLDGKETYGCIALGMER